MASTPPRPLPGAKSRSPRSPSPPDRTDRGIRLGGFIQIRAEWTAEVEAALNGQKTMQEALDTAVERGNAILARFAQTYAGKTFP